MRMYTHDKGSGAGRKPDRTSHQGGRVRGLLRVCISVVLLASDLLWEWSRCLAALGGEHHCQVSSHSALIPIQFSPSPDSMARERGKRSPTSRWLQLASVAPDGTHGCSPWRSAAGLMEPRWVCRPTAAVPNQPSSGSSPPPPETPQVASPSPCCSSCPGASGQIKSAACRASLST